MGRAYSKHHARFNDACMTARLPVDLSELDHVGLRTRSSLRVALPRIADAPLA
jgi:hypothetical protein